MKIFQTICLMLLASLASIPAHAQLDTLFFDDFSGDASKWNRDYADRGEQVAADGLLNVVTRVPKGTTRFYFFPHDLQNADTFAFEVKFIPEMVNFVGVGVDACMARMKKGKPALCGYEGIAVNEKCIWGYGYSRSSSTDGSRFRNKNFKISRNEPFVLRVSYGSKRLWVELNGDTVYNYRHFKGRKHLPFQNWGWIMRGYNKFAIDYVLLQGKKTSEG